MMLRCIKKEKGGTKYATIFHLKDLVCILKNIIHSLWKYLVGLASDNHPNEQP